MTDCLAAPTCERSLRRAPGLSTERFLFAAIIGCFALQAWLVFKLSINWDEYRFLADVHLLARGELTAAVQTFHSHFFQWLLWLPGNEIDQIIAARFVMLLLEMGTAAMIYRCARRFAGPEASLICVLCYLTTSYVMRHGASFRFDPLSTFLLMAAVTLLTTVRLRLATVGTVGALVAVAALITIKSVFYVPTLVLLAWWRADGVEDRRMAWLKLLAGSAIGGAVLLLLYVYHQSFIAESIAAQDIVSGSVEKTIGESGFLPGLSWLLRSFLESPLNWLTLMGGITLAMRSLLRARRGERSRAIALISFGLPLCTLLFYRNAFPYYYVFMLAPAAVLAALFAESIVPRIRLDLIGAALLGLGAVHTFVALSPVLAAQRTTLEAIHFIFPDPVAYIDRSSMVASSRKEGFFMSSWGTEVYRAAGRPIMWEILTERRPAYVLINSPILEWAVAGEGTDRRMLPEDTAVLRNNFIPHWGPVWVAGKRLNLTDRSITFDILIAGPYTVESSSHVSIDGKNRLPGAVSTLRAGRHTIIGSPGQSVTLRWGRHLPRPTTPPPFLLFDDF